MVTNGDRHTHTHTHVRNAVTLVWGSLVGLAQARPNQLTIHVYKVKF